MPVALCMVKLCLPTVMNHPMGERALRGILNVPGVTRHTHAICLLIHDQPESIMVDTIAPSPDVPASESQLTPDSHHSN